ncbi:unnamed protein product [Cuscuta campestris]|uniref:Uncharacterized protein n=1 Tax=Cuscuta campestris TaxID=132261 RepID=A0A484M4Z9_9ASTE|nr:unnamed protein product [Cuscuta campestris]
MKWPPPLIPQLGSTNPLSSKRMNFEKWPNFWAEASGSTILMLSEESVYLIIRTPRSFWVPPGQLTVNAHKYVGSYILWCCALDRTPTLDKFLVLFNIDGAFPYYNLFPHPQSPAFERVESKIDKWAHRYFVIEFPVHSPIHLPGTVRRSSLSRTPFAAIPQAEAALNALGEEGGLISYHSLQDARWYKKADFYYPLGPVPIPFEGVSSPERSKASPVVESHPAESSSGNQAQGNATALAICKPSATLDSIPISTIPGLRKPTPSRRRPREGVTDDDFLPKKSKGDGIPALLSPLIASSGTQNTTTAAASGATSQGVEEEAERQKEPDAFPAMEKDVGGQKKTEASPEMEREVGKQQEPEEQRSAATPPAFNLPIRRKFTPQTYPAFKEGWVGFSRSLNSLQASHWTIQANLEKMRESMQEPIIPQARPDLLALNALHSMEQAQQSLLTLTEEYLCGAWGNYRAMVVLKEKELAARALQHRVGSLEQQVRALQEENAKLKADGSAELMAERSRVKSLQEQIAICQRGTQDLETQFDKLRAQISSLESKTSDLEDKVGSLKAEIPDLALKKLEKERKTANELRSKMGELEKTMASHQEEVAALTARDEALYEDIKLDMRHCIYEAIRSGLPAHRSLDDFISYYGLTLPLPPPDSHANQEP